MIKTRIQPGVRGRAQVIDTAGCIFSSLIFQPDDLVQIEPYNSCKGGCKAKEKLTEGNLTEFKSMADRRHQEKNSQEKR